MLSVSNERKGKYKRKIVHQDFKMTFEDVKPMVKLKPERLEEQEKTGLMNSSGSGIQETDVTLQRGQRGKDFTDCRALITEKKTPK